jgi:hypothetical protein
VGSEVLCFWSKAADAALDLKQGAKRSEGEERGEFRGGLRERWERGSGRRRRRGREKKIERN